MERVLDILAGYQWWIYGLLGLVLIFYLRRAMLARRETARSIFTLEQEQARARYNRSVGISAVILLLVVATFAVSNPLLPVANPTPEPTPTVTTGPLVAPTLTPTLLPPTATPTVRPTPVTPTVGVRPTATVGPAATDPPAVAAPACPHGNARITSPGMNQVLSGNVAIRGTANIEGFQFFKIEIAPGNNPQDHQWTVLGDLHRQPVVAGVLAQFNSGALAPGIYMLRLVVVDQTSNYPEPCRVTIVIQR